MPHQTCRNGRRRIAAKWQGPCHVKWHLARCSADPLTRSRPGFCSVQAAAACVQRGAKMQPGGKAAQRGQIAGNDLEPRRHGGIGQGVINLDIALQQTGRIGVAAPRQNRADRAIFDHLARIHHGHRFAVSGDKAQAMGDQQNGAADFIAQRAKPVHHLRLDRHIQRRCRFICDQQFGPRQQGHGDDHPLLHAAAELVGELPQPLARVRSCRRQPAPRSPMRRGRRGQGRAV